MIDAASSEERYGHTALQFDQILSLAGALKLALEAECDAPLQGNIPGALAIAIERAAEDGLALFEAYYHPVQLEADAAGITVAEHIKVLEQQRAQVPIVRPDDFGSAYS